MGQLIVVVVDGSTSSRIAADWAAGEAELRRLPLRVVRPSALPDEQLLSLAAQADCTVLGLRGTGGFAGLPVGSVAHQVAQRSDRPVVLMPRGSNRGRSGRRPDRVALGIDARDPAGDVLDFAFEAAQRCRALLHAVHAWQPPSPAGQWMPFALPEEDRGTWEDQEVQLLSDALRPWREKYPQVRVYEDVRLQSPSAALLQASASAGFLVVGRGGTALGATLQALLNHTKCPVAVVPHGRRPRFGKARPVTGPAE